MSGMNTVAFLKQVEEQRSLEHALTWEGTFSDYLELAAKNPHVADLAHARVYNMIMAAGFDESPETHVRRYKFFEEEL